MAHRDSLSLSRSDGSIPPDAYPSMSEADSSSSPHSHAPHHHHEAISKRLKRAEGHLRSVLQMIESGRNCVDIAQQLFAVERAITQAKRTLIQDHLDHCLEDVVGSLPRSQRGPIDEFKTITKYL